MPRMQRTGQRLCADMSPMQRAGYRRPDRAGNPRRAHREEIGVNYMTKLNNPAARLYALLQTAKQGGDKYRQKPSTESWSMLLNAPADNQALMLKRLGGVMELPAVIKGRIENLADADHSLYMRWLPKVEEAFRANHLAGGFHTFIDKIDDATLLGI